MTEFPETRESLLVQIRSPSNREAWDQFALLYCPVIYRLVRRRGLQDADAQDLAQQVLMAVASAIGRWEKSNESVRFHHWLRRVVRNAIVNALTRRPQDRAAGSSSVQELLLEQSGDDLESDAQIELEYRRELYLRAIDTITGKMTQEIRSTNAPASNARQSGHWNDFEIPSHGGKQIVGGVDNDRKGCVEIWDWSDVLPRSEK